MQVEDLKDWVYSLIKYRDNFSKVVSNING